MPPPLKPQLPAGATKVTDSALRALAARLSAATSITVLSGAGISTESGLSDYRSPGKSKPPRPPINHHDYIVSHATRKRYWARSFVGFPVLSNARPGLAHHALAALHDRHGHLFKHHITQNVDGLLQAARMPFHQLLELHGTIHALQCRACAHREDRTSFQNRLTALNRSWALDLGRYQYRPDGDAELDENLVSRFKVPHCRVCGQDALMPSVIFHGGTVPLDVTREATRLVEVSNALLVVGSSVTPYSAYRLVKLAKQCGAFVACINFGPTRADQIIDIKLEGLIGDAVSRLADLLLQGGFRVPDGVINYAHVENDPLDRRLQL